MSASSAQLVLDDGNRKGVQRAQPRYLLDLQRLLEGTSANLCFAASHKVDLRTQLPSMFLLVPISGYHVLPLFRCSKGSNSGSRGQETENRLSKVPLYIVYLLSSALYRKL